MPLDKHFSTQGLCFPVCKTKEPGEGSLATPGSWETLVSYFLHVGAQRMLEFHLSPMEQSVFTKCDSNAQSKSRLLLMVASPLSVPRLYPLTLFTLSPT